MKAFQRFAQRLEALAVSRFANFLSHDRERLGYRHGGPVGAIGCQGVGDVGNRQNARFQDNFLALQSLGIAFAVKPFVMRAGTASG